MGKARPGGIVVGITDLAVSCWCMREIVHVPAAEVKAGRTASCGRSGCKP